MKIYETNRRAVIILKGRFIQAAIDSLNCYFRLLIGQYDFIDMLYLWNSDKHLDKDKQSALDSKLLLIRNTLCPDLVHKPFSACRGIYNENNPPEALEAYNLMCVIRSTRAKYSSSESNCTVDYREPIRKEKYPIAKAAMSIVFGIEEMRIEMQPEQLEILIASASMYSALLSGKFYEAFACVTQQENALAIAKEAEQYYPCSIQPQVIRIAAMFHAYLISQKATLGRMRIPKYNHITSFKQELKSCNYMESVIKGDAEWISRNALFLFSVLADNERRERLGERRKSMRQLIIARKDLNMPPGKLAAQVSHASMAFLVHMIRTSRTGQILSEDTGEPLSYDVAISIPVDIYEQWFMDIFTKTICEAKNRNQLLKAVDLAKEQGLIEGKDYFLIYDNCLTELQPEKISEDGIGRTLTCIGFRPLPDDIAHAISKKFQLYR